MKRKNSAINHAPGAREALIGAMNSQPVDAGDWLQISPYGEFPNKVGLQVFGKPQADKMVAAFNSLLARAARFFRGVPIYRGHPDADPQTWPDDRRLGKIEALEARADGLYGRVAWNDIGQQNIDQGYWVYPSPRWYWTQRAAVNGKPAIEPDELISVGLTNTPNISRSVPWTANAVDEPGNKPNQTEPMNPQIIAALVAAGLVQTGADDAAVIAAVNSLVAEKATQATKVTEGVAAAATAAARIAELETALNTEKTAKDTAENALKTARTAARDVIIQGAINDGRLPESERAATVTAFDAGFDAAATALAARKPALNTQRLDLSRQKPALKTDAERQSALNTAVRAEMHAKGISYDAAWNAVKADPEKAHLFERVKPAAV